jgi:hypothetical protein
MRSQSSAATVVGIALLGLFFIACLALAPLTVGFSLIPGLPALLLAIWLGRHEPAEYPDISLGGAIALTLAVLAMLWVFVALWRDTDIYGRPL